MYEDDDNSSGPKIQHTLASQVKHVQEACTYVHKCRYTSLRVYMSQFIRGYKPSGQGCAGACSMSDSFTNHWHTRV